MNILTRLTHTLVRLCTRVLATTSPDFFSFVRTEQQTAHGKGAYSTAEKYGTALRHLMHFYGKPTLHLTDITDDLMTHFEHYLQERNLSPNTTSCYMRSLSACYNRAIAHYGLPPAAPFRHVYTGVGKTRKRALERRDIQRLAALDLTAHPKLSFVRDLFLFSFYMRGMSLIDLVYLTPSNRSGNTIVYHRRKTHQQITVHLERSALSILQRYATKHSPYLFPVLTATNEADAHRQYRTFLAIYNKRLAEISQLLSLPYPITGYMARHTWATIARDAGIPTYVISSALGHTSESTTQIYLSDVKNTVVDTANRKVVATILRSIPQPAAPDIATTPGKSQKKKQKEKVETRKPNKINRLPPKKKTQINNFST